MKHFSKLELHFGHKGDNNHPVYSATVTLADGAGIDFFERRSKGSLAGALSAVGTHEHAIIVDSEDEMFVFAESKKDFEAKVIEVLDKMDPPPSCGGH